MAFKPATDALTTALRIKGVYLFATDTSRPVETISEHAGATKLPLVALSSERDLGYDR